MPFKINDAVVVTDEAWLAKHPERRDMRARIIRLGEQKGEPVAGIQWDGGGRNTVFQKRLEPFTGHYVTCSGSNERVPPEQVTKLLGKNYSFKYLESLL